ncbi:DnaD domain-containing protein [Chengkuizengella axinellae]|uniref:DnaD domain protein n=1 Tax=Chengkuizengella axinellae TaxID=3064388 RepID=A0ABT9IWY1_9BACL|nr:DnaD domain protein [Chengkuizengella sp. 2205SS18-9]MDP5273856.1 DnaD domain protein [Chengkuizengella sp. 2205SS18-9]
MIHDNSQLTKGIQLGLEAGTVDVPYLLLKYYKHLNLSEAEVMMMIHIISFKEKEKKEFPTLEEIQFRMSVPPDQVIHFMQKMMKDGFILIDEKIDPITGVQSECYNLQPLMEKLIGSYVDDMLLSESSSELDPIESSTEMNLFSIFEQEFARPLSPMELETISGWIDHDQYKEELILAALKEAVFAGKVHFRYIDRILLDWSRNRVFTADQAKEYSQRFRGAR